MFLHVYKRVLNDVKMVLYSEQFGHEVTSSHFCAVYNLGRQCPKYCVNEKTGFRYNLLYLDSVFKYKNKLVHNQPPIMNWLCPFLLNFHQ